MIRSESGTKLRQGELRANRKIMFSLVLIVEFQDDKIAHNTKSYHGRDGGCLIVSLLLLKEITRFMKINDEMIKEKANCIGKSNYKFNASTEIKLIHNYG